MIYENFSIQMINFMLKNTGQKALSGYSVFPAIDAEGLNANFIVTCNFSVHVWDAQAALEILNDFSFIFGYAGIDEDTEGMVVFVVKIITYNNYAQKLINLYSREGDTYFMFATIFPIDGRILHVCDDGFDIFRNDAYFFGSLAQVRMRQRNYVIFCHLGVVYPIPIRMGMAL